MINVSTVTQTFTIEAYDGGGNLIGRSGPIQIPAGGGFGFGPGVTAYCKFIASGAPGDVRASAYSSDANRIGVFPAH